MMKKVVSMLLIMVMVFSQVAIVSADGAIDTQGIPQEFIEDRNLMIKNWNKYMPENENLEVLSSVAGSLGRRGDILTSFDSVTGHASLVIDSLNLIEAHPDSDGVAIWDNNWTVRYNLAKHVRVPSATSTNITNALAYANKQLGDPYDILAGRMMDHKWYCSLLIWRSYLEQGIDVEEGADIVAGPYVTPYDLVSGDNTTIIGSYGY